MDSVGIVLEGFSQNQNANKTTKLPPMKMSGDKAAVFCETVIRLYLSPPSGHVHLQDGDGR